MAELTVYDLLADVIFITETWLSSCSSFTLYNIPGHTSFHGVRNNSRGGGALIFMRNEIASINISTVITCNNSYNICAVAIHLGTCRFSLLFVYRSSGASTNNTKDMCNLIDFYMQSYNYIIMAGDFHFSSMQWVLLANHCDNSHCERLLRMLISEHHLVQVITQPTRGKIILDLMLMSEMLTANSIEYF